MDDRDQLWAEGAELFKNGGVRFRDAEVLATDEHAKYAITDDWHEGIAQWLASANEIDVVDLSKGVTTVEIMAGALSMPAKLATQTTKRRIGGVLKILGYTSIQKIRDGIKGWYWLKDVVELSEDEDWA